MRLLTRQLVITEFVKQFIENKAIVRSEQVIEKLIALGENPDPDTVDQIMSDTHGKELTKQILGTCDKCNKFYETLCELDVVYGERVAICVDCARAAYEKFS